MSAKKKLVQQAMTKEQFFEKLMLTKEKIHWSMGAMGIRGTCNGNEFCPITAVVYIQTNPPEFHFPRFWDTAIKKINLEEDLAKAMIHAADGFGVTDLELELHQEFLTRLDLEELPDEEDEPTPVTAPTAYEF